LGGSSGTIGEYTTAGALVNAALITGLNDPSYLTTPEPTTLALAGLGGLSLLLARRRK
jgi:hypothetical protein